MNNSELFKAAHKLAKSVIQKGDDYRITFGACLKKIKQSMIIQEMIKDTLNNPSPVIPVEQPKKPAETVFYMAAQYRNDTNVVCFTGSIERTTDKAVMIKTAKGSIWIPKAALVEDGDNYIIARWFKFRGQAFKTFKAVCEIYRA